MHLASPAGIKNGWAFFSRDGRYVGVSLSTFDVTDILEGPDAELLEIQEWSADEPDPDSHELAHFLADEAFLDRTPLPVDLDARYHPPLAVVSSAAAGYASLSPDESLPYGSLAKRIPSRDGLTLGEVRRMVRYFLTRPSEDSALYRVYGGDPARSWARQVIASALTAAAEAPQPAVPPTTPPGADDVPTDIESAHIFFPSPVDADLCLFCLRDEGADVHQDASAPNYALVDIDRASAHYYTEADGAEGDVCEICGNPADFTLHRQAALADYYQFKQAYDRIYGANRDYWERYGKKIGVTAGGVVVVPAEDGPDADMARAIAAENMAERLFWQREGNEDEDDLAYWITSDIDDEMTARELYVSTGGDYFRLDPVAGAWVMVDRLPPDTEPFEIDDDTAGECLLGLIVTGGAPFDMRLADPEEWSIVEAALPALTDDPMIDRSLLAAGEGDGQYTPEERAENAAKQLRDKYGRFARVGVSVKTPDGRTGYVTLAEPDGRTIHVQHSPDEPAVKYDVRDVEVQSRRNEIRQAISGIEGKPRASINTPKAWKDLLLPPLDSNTMIRMMDDYPAYVESMRAGAADREAAWDAYDAESRRKAEEKDAAARRRWEEIYSGLERENSPAAAIWNQISQWWKEDKARGWVASLLAAAGFTDPSQSDVPPVNMAVVNPSNKEEVLDLISLVPASATSSRPVLLKRVAGGKWEQDMKLLRQMQSRTPPTVVVLSPQEFEDVTAQVDSYYSQGAAEPEPEPETEPEAAPEPAAMALYDTFGGVPGIADTPGDIANVNRLKRYWTVGKGGLKIRWNTPGDWTRCNRYLRKYMGPRAKGYCANLHKLMTGVWPGDRRNVGKKRRKHFSGYVVNTSEGVMTLTADAAVRSGEQPAVSADEVGHGAPFVIEVLAPVGVKSGDGREFSKGALSYRDLPIPLLWQMKTQDGHNSSVIVGRIDTIDQMEDGSLGNARGVFDTGPYGREAERLVRNKFLRGVSVDLDEFEATTKTDPSQQPTLSADDDSVETRIAPNETKITKGRVIAATLVAKPAFQECSIELEDGAAGAIEGVEDGIYIGDPTTEDEMNAMVASALLASAIPVHPPKSWFANPELDGPTPITVTDEGRVFGHVATWNTDHIGLPFSTRPPHSKSGYAYFQTGVLRTEEGEDIHVGQITLAGGHAPLQANAAAAAKHYDDTASAVCDVQAGEDAHGIWVSGALRPGVTPEQVRVMRASVPSGDWRPINGRLEMVAVCQVNVPGFPVTRARVASGAVYALVAAGTATLNRIRYEGSSQANLANRVEALEQSANAELTAKRDAATAVFNTVRSERADAARQRFASMMDAEESMFREVSPQLREKYAKEGIALKDGSFPIKNVSDLKNAIRAYGRAKNKAAARRHIKKRARALGKTDLIPDSWSTAALVSEESKSVFAAALQESADEINQRMKALVSGGYYPDGTPWDPKRHPRDDEGRFREAVATLKRDLSEAGKEEGVSKLDKAEDELERGDLEAARDSARDVLKMVDQLSPGEVEGDELHGKLREGYRSLGSAVANMPLQMGSMTQKFKYSELPEDLQSLIDDLLTRVKSRLEGDALDKASSIIESFKSGVDVLSQPEISAELARMLRYLI
jgi:hypothetical protein